VRIGIPTVNFHGERRSNATHQSTTDPEAKLAKKGAGKEAKLCHSANALMENRHALLVDWSYPVSVDSFGLGCLMVLAASEFSH